MCSSVTTSQAPRANRSQYNPVPYARLGWSWPGCLQAGSANRRATCRETNRGTFSRAGGCTESEHRVRAQEHRLHPGIQFKFSNQDPCSNSNSHVPAAIAVLQAVRVGGANVDVDPTTATVALGLDDGTSHKGEDGCGNFDRHDWELPKRRCRAKCHRAVDPFVQQLWARAGRRRLRWNLAAATTTWRTVPVPQVSGEGRNLRFKRKMTCEMKMQRRRKLRTTLEYYC